MGPMGSLGPMGDWDIFAYNFIITGWILTKILLDIDIDVFYLNTGRFFHDGSIKGTFPMDFDFLVCSLLAALASLLRSPHYVCSDIITHAHCQTRQFSVTINSIKNGALGKPFHFEFSNSNSTPFKMPSGPPN